MATIGLVAAILLAVVYWRFQATPAPKGQSVIASPSSPVAPEVAPAVAPPVAPQPPPEAKALPKETAKVVAPTPEPTIRHAIEDKLRGAGMLRGSNPDDSGVTIADVGADGRVRLVGVLKNRSAREAAADLVRAVAGVTAVDVSRVTVKEGWSSQ
jgi:predicted component of type VI protein secretion system